MVVFNEEYMTTQFDELFIDPFKFSGKLKDLNQFARARNNGEDLIRSCHTRQFTGNQFQAISNEEIIIFPGTVSHS